MKPWRRKKRKKRAKRDSEVFFESEDAGEDHTSCTEELADETLESLLEPTWIDDGPTYYAQEANFWMNLDEAAALADSNDEDIAICPDPWRFLPMFSEFEDVQTACFEADEGPLALRCLAGLRHYLAKRGLNL